MRRLLLIGCLLVGLFSWLSAEPIKSGQGDDLATVDTAGNLRVARGHTTVFTYAANLNVPDSTVGSGILGGLNAAFTSLQLVGLCLSFPTLNGGAVTVVVRRYSGDTAWTATGSGSTAQENTSAPPAIGKLEPGTANGPFYIQGFLDGTNGAILDQWSFVAGENSAGGLADPTNVAPICRSYATGGAKPPTTSGLTNGFRITADGAGIGLTNPNMTATVRIE